MVRSAVVPGFRVVSGGALTTVQDIGIVGYQKYGIPQTGVMDVYCYKLANALVSAESGAAVLECTYGGLQLEFDMDVAIAVTGADSQITIDGEPAQINESHLIRSGSTLSIGIPVRGVRNYLAFGADIGVPKFAGSKSTSLKTGTGGFLGRALRAGDVLALTNPRKFVKKSASGNLVKYSTLSPGSAIIRALAGPQDDYFTAEGLKTFFGGSAYRVTQLSDRMGMRLDGDAVEAKNGFDIISDATVRGSVQVPADGKPIILLSDRQTTGGYAKIATVLTPDVDKLAQLRAGDSIIFKSCTAEEADEIYREYIKMLDFDLG